MTSRPLILLVDDDGEARHSLKVLLELAGYRVQDHASAESLLRELDPEAKCLITDIRMSGMDGLALQAELVRRRIFLPVIFVTGHGDIALAVRGLKAGALEFLEKPFDAVTLLAALSLAVTIGEEAHKAGVEKAWALHQLSLLTRREHLVFDQLVAGQSTKIAAHILGISPRTIEIHRSNIRRKLKVRSLADLTRIACAAPQAA